MLRPVRHHNECADAILAHLHWQMCHKTEQALVYRMAIVYGCLS